MRNKIFGAIGVIWGGLIVLRWFMHDAGQTTVQSQAFRAGYGMGQHLAVVFGAIMFVSGLYYFFKKPKQA
jgi:hypothetical protein